MPNFLRKLWRKMGRTKCKTDACNTLAKRCGFCEHHCIYTNCPIHGKKETGYDFNDERETRYMYKGEWMTAEEAKLKELGNQIPSVKDIATELGIFPSEVEKAVMALQEQGKVKCYIVEGEIYVVFNEGTTTDDILSPLPLRDDDVMFH